MWSDRRLQRKLSKSCATEKERAGVQYLSPTFYNYCFFFFFFKMRRIKHVKYSWEGASREVKVKDQG